MQAEVRFSPSGRGVRVPLGTTLWKAIRSAGLPVASACGADGICGRCGVTVIEGGDSLSAETLWACRSCGACMEICPVGVEHPTMIVQMRRHLMERDEMDQQLRDTFGRLADRGNSFGESPRQRGAWTQPLEFPVKDIREEAADNLWFVGDYASYDPRNQSVSQTVRACSGLPDLISPSSATANTAPATMCAGPAKKVCSRPWSSTIRRP